MITPGAPCSPLPAPCSLLGPARHPVAPLRAAAPVQPAAALDGAPALGDAALDGNGDGYRAALDGAALLAAAAVSGHPAAGHAVVGPQLLPRWLSRVIVPRGRGQVIASRARHGADAAARGG